MEIGLHQGSALSPFLFAVVLDELSKSIQEIIPCCVIFADDIVLVVESKKDQNMRLGEWRVAIERKGLRISRSKTEYLHCDFSGSDGGIESDVTHRVQVGWCRWRAAIGVLCDKRFPTKLKGTFYRVAIRPAILYGTDCWAIKKAHTRKLE
ncbi:uncharacterized protein LOC143594426, partial [Bidens hawaiensis]|uniref:uncharacterized protein LOC143594426 n=1 Tax=Bidens hawaiensis TaxID=980011 RepID=UPI00404A5C33